MHVLGKCTLIHRSVNLLDSQNKQNIITYVAIYYQIHSEILNKRLLDLNILVLILITTSHGKNNYCVNIAHYF